MSQSEQEFLEELRKAFALEAAEHMQTIVAGLIAIEKTKDPAAEKKTIEAVFRAAHSLKGAARSVNMPDIGAVCQSLESVFSAMKKGLLVRRAGDFDELHHAVDGISRMLASPTREGDAAVGTLIEQLNRIAAAGKGSSEAPAPLLADPASPFTPFAGPKSGSEKPGEPGLSSVGEESIPEPACTGTEQTAKTPAASAAATAPADAPATPAMSETIRVAATKLDAILLQAEELIAVKLGGEQRLAELGDILTLFEPWKKEWEKAGATTRSGASLLETETRLEGLRRALHDDLRATVLLVDHLLKSTKTMLLLPFSVLLQALPRMVRDISRDQGKEVELAVSGGEIEVDKRILERMKDPLVHLVRNSIDHGIEKPDVRRGLNKPAVGTISIRISQVENNKVEVAVADDGSGIDWVRVIKNAVKRGLLSPEDAGALDEQSALPLIFQSGVSTSDLITDISGRGLGMAIVKEAVDELDGSISIETRKDKGASFRLTLPQALAKFRGILVREYGKVFALPTSSVERVIRIRKDEVVSIENREAVALEGAPISLVRLGGVLELSPVADGSAERKLLTVVILNAGQTRMAFAVDNLLNEQEILIKGLGKQLVRVRNISGVTVLGSGQVIPVLNVVDLMRSAARAGKTASPASPTAAEAEKRTAVLVAEDSITSRMLLKNILSSAGLDVHTVVDGMEAWAALKEKPFDIVVSDVDMPGMNGFDLTAKIRGEAKWADLPVVLVTSLESRQDRERGAEVGADAYIVKSSFDQSNLLEVVRRLI